MDLKRKLGLGSDSRQSYELIRSTQSLVDRLNLDTEDITIQPVHPSIMGQVEYLHVTKIFGVERDLALFAWLLRHLRLKRSVEHSTLNGYLPSWNLFSRKLCGIH